MRAALVVLLACAAAAAGGLDESVFVVRITTESATQAGTSRQTLAGPALPVGPDGLLLAVGFFFDAPRPGSEEAVRVSAIGPDGRELKATMLGGDENLRCTFFRLEGLRPKPVALESVPLGVGDPVEVLGRYGELMRFSPRRWRTEVEAVVSAPKRYYALRDAELIWRGCIVATPAGRLVGFVDTRPTITEGSGLMLGVGANTPVVVPAIEFAALARTPPEPGPPAHARAWIGVNLAPFDKNREAFFSVKEDWQGALVTGVSPDSPAARAGIRLHDVLQTIGKTRIRYERPDEWDDMLRAVQRLPLGVPLPCRVVRFTAQPDGEYRSEALDLTMVLSARPIDFEEAPETEIPDLGLHVKPMTNNWRRGANLPADVSGVVVTRIERASPGLLAGLRPDDLILSLDNRPVRDVKSFLARMAEARTAKRKKIVLFVRRGTETAFLAVEPDW